MHEYYEKLFWSKVDKSGDCWVWTNSLATGGYGRFKYNQKPVLAHRMAFELTNGPIPHGKLVLHRCNNRACVNPSHLYLGDRSDNMQDMYRRTDLNLNRTGRIARFYSGELWLIRKLHPFVKGVQLAKMFKCSAALISLIAKNLNYPCINC